MTVSRRSFVGGFAAALGYLGVGTEIDLFAQGRHGAPAAPRAPARSSNDYDSFAHLSSNENCWGPPESVMKAMNNAWKYSNRYGYPDGNIVGEIAKHHGVKPENILLDRRLRRSPRRRRHDVPARPARRCSASSRRTARSTSTPPASSPTAIKLPLGKDYRQDIPAMIKAANAHARGARVRLPVQPEQPDRHRSSPKEEVKQLLDGIPEGHAGADRRGVPPLRRRSELRDVGAVRPRRAPGDHRAHVLEDRGARRHAPRLRRRAAEIDRQDAAVQHGQHQRAREVRRRRRRSRTRRRRPT